MEVRALCIKLSAVFLHVVPNRSQFFEYEPVTFYCEGVSHYNVVHKLRGKIKSCSYTNEKTATGSSCSIKNIYTEDSGEFICETGGGEKSNIINISVTGKFPFSKQYAVIIKHIIESIYTSWFSAGSVILESPAVPVMEGEDVTMSCRNKTTFSSFTAEFYKDGLPIRNSSTGYMTIGRVSKSDEGLYKCSISGAGESPESWLTVTANHTESETDPSSQPGCHIYLILRTVFTIMMLVLLLLLVGLLHCGKISN
ncbi:Fc receptor-like B isoform X1 [Oreochromis aureus]|uniref:Fc receptor-like B isoform X1 n=1 Tax=Oreochromis aureus TaxID=47969 RepID=UPI0019537A96|nr:Fc receptor-like B isoform X1 [Oreochromis aureus]